MSRFTAEIETCGGMGWTIRVGTEHDKIEVRMLTKNASIAGTATQITGDEAAALVSALQTAKLLLTKTA